MGSHASRVLPKNLLPHGTSGPQLVGANNHNKRRKDAVWQSSILASLFCVEPPLQLSAMSLDILLPATGAAIASGLDKLLIYDGSISADVLGVGDVAFHVHPIVNRDAATISTEDAPSLVQFIHDQKDVRSFVTDEVLISCVRDMRSQINYPHEGNLYILRFLIPKGSHMDVVAKSVLATNISVQGKVRALTVSVDAELAPGSRTSSAKWRPVASVRSFGRSMLDERVAISEDCVRIMRASPFFADISSRDLTQLADLGTISLVDANVRLMAEGELGGREMSILLAGTIAVQKMDPVQGTLRTVAVLHSGACIGETSFLVHMPRTATLVTEATCMLISLDGSSFLRFLQNFPQVHRKLQGMLCERFVQNIAAQGGVPFFRAIPFEHLLAWAQHCYIEDGVPAFQSVLPIVGTPKFSILLSGSVEHLQSGTQKTLVSTTGYFGSFGHVPLPQAGPWGSEASTTTPCVFLSCDQVATDRVFDRSAIAAIQLRLSRQKIDVLPLLDLPDARKALLEFADAEFSTENLLFILAVQQFKLSPSLERAISIGNEYIDDRAAQQVNIEAKMREEILSSLALRVPRSTRSLLPVLLPASLATLFDSAFDEILRLVRKDTLPRFKKTSLFADLLSAYPLFLHECRSAPSPPPLNSKRSEVNNVHRRFAAILNQVRDDRRRRRKLRSINHRPSLLEPLFAAVAPHMPHAPTLPR
ncbi:hypothetical protein SDRG_04834 [Saprolegnia diclina VS20]|uniref:Cyclic nucleotide-binding domain-containing protein n=1 Tax=Saprolegnia diclina (strain VS20) TaxID=1156394 RepID=T0QUU2_SAPDV|nr:hypothetical protein SDRG_04834 [Saprolegnia diclina VS20]EQC37810.1 hypothetical protein SDRG_04834 [Saprolegnia diclina VS20]|eukprot:XP_008608743.1 hypothetical protein SDRG_04834 [Saprolegnia diclina VS20]